MGGEGGVALTPLCVDSEGILRNQLPAVLPFHMH